MDDHSDDRDDTEPVCAPLVHLETTMHPVPDSPNGKHAVEHGEAEPCEMSPMITIEVKLKPVKSADKPAK